MHLFPHKYKLQYLASRFYFSSNLKGSSAFIKEKTCEGCKIQQLDSKLICGICSAIKTPIDILKRNNYFEIFNLNQNFSIDKGLLEKKYKDIQKVIHPDKYAAQGDKATLDQAHNASSLVVKAYNILKDDYKRANYLLNLKGYENVEEKNVTIKDIKFLQSFMELQEKIEEAESKEEILEIKADIDDAIKALTDELEKNFANETLEKALEILNSIKFNLSLLDNINKKI